MRCFFLLVLAVVWIAGGTMNAEQPETADVKALLQKASDASRAGKSQQAVELLTRAIRAKSDSADAYYRRGREYFRLAKVNESVADFDKFVSLRPQSEKSLWERGISQYYAGQFEKGAKQFELYQTFHDNDVENSVWRYLCMVRTEGVKKARAEMLEIKNDPRVPMMEIYDLYRGKLHPEDVLKAARRGTPPPEVLAGRMFYTHLYLGLHHESLGEAAAAKKHIFLAADEHENTKTINHYMWDVAHVHAQLLRKNDQAPTQTD